MDSIHLLKSLKKEVSSHLSSNDIAFSNELISTGVIGEELEEINEKYMKSLVEKGMSFSEIEKKANHIDIYITLNRSLLFSYNLEQNSMLKIPTKYYAEAPKDFESLMVVIPNLKIIIKAENFNKKMGYGTQFNKASNLICIKTYYNKRKDEWFLLQEGSFLNAYYPRYSIACPEHCNAYIETTINRYYDDTPIPTYIGECKMSPNRECICIRNKEAKEFFNAPSLSDCYALVMMCFDRWKNRPVRINTAKSKTYNDEGVSTIFVQTQDDHKSTTSFKEIPIRNTATYIANMRSHGWKVRNRLSPCEHCRREHIRHLKSGKIVTVRSSIVNKGKAKAIYNIKD